MPVPPSPPLDPDHPTRRSSKSSRSPPNNPPFKWGFQFKPEEKRLRCIKLFLDRSQALPTYISPLETAGLLREAGKVWAVVETWLARLTGARMC